MLAVQLEKQLDHWAELVYDFAEDAQVEDFHYQSRLEIDLVLEQMEVFVEEEDIVDHTAVENHLDSEVVRDVVVHVVGPQNRVHLVLVLVHQIRVHQV